MSLFSCDLFLILQQRQLVGELMGFALGPFQPEACIQRFVRCRRDLIAFFDHWSRHRVKHRRARPRSCRDGYMDTNQEAAADVGRGLQAAAATRNKSSAGRNYDAGEVEDEEHQSPEDGKELQFLFGDRPSFGDIMLGVRLVGVHGSCNRLCVLFRRRLGCAVWACF